MDDARSIVVVIVNYNSGRWLKPCIQSLLESSVSVDIVVVDNNSNDDSLNIIGDVVHRNDNISSISNPDNQGFAKANNIVLTRIHNQPRYYVLINPDCTVEQDTIKTITEEMDRDESIGLASCVIYNQDGTVQKTCRRRFPTPLSALLRTVGGGEWLQRKTGVPDFDYGDEIPEQVDYVDAVSGAFMVVRMKAMRDVGPLDEGYFLHCEDLDWCKRFWAAGYKVGFVPDTSVRHIKGGSGRSYLVTWYLHKGMWRFYRKFYRRFPSNLLFPLVFLGVTASLLVRTVGILGRSMKSPVKGCARLA